MPAESKSGKGNKRRDKSNQSKSSSKKEEMCSGGDHCTPHSPKRRVRIGEKSNTTDEGLVNLIQDPTLNAMQSQATDVSHYQRLRKALKPHSKYVILGLQVCTVLLLLLYFVLPTVIKLFPSIIAEIAFLNKVRWPPFVNLSNPAEFGLNATRAFTLDTTEDVTIGVWHTIPDRLQSPELRPGVDYESTLSNGAPIILYLHGNAGTRGAWHRVQLYKLFARTGFHVITLDYRGYGDSSGFPTEDGVCHDGYMVYRWLLTRAGDVPIYVWGHSMGTGVATKVSSRLAEEGLPLKGLFLESPFNNIIEAATQHPFSQPFKFLPWFTWGFIEAMKYNKIRFSSDISISKVTAPTLILHAKDDGIVPYSLGRKLYEVALTTKMEGRVQMVTFKASHGYGHKHIHKAPELVGIIWDFIHDNKMEIVY